MDPPARDLDDLGCTGLVEEARAVEALAPKRPLDQVRPNTGGSLVSARFGNPAVLDELVLRADEYGQLVAQGRDIVEDLHAHPMRQIALHSEVHLLGAYSSAEGVVVVHATWAVERLANRLISEARLDMLDDFSLPDDEPRLGRLLRDLAVRTRYEPRRARTRVGLVVSNKVRRLNPSIGEELRAAIAVSDARPIELDPPVDRDDTSFFVLDERLRGNQFSTLVLAHDQEQWAWARHKSFGERWERVAISVAPQDPTAADRVQAAIELIAQGSTPVPATDWGDGSLTRIARRTSDAFALTDQAKAHLAGNKYPKVERMLDHLERLADLAQDFHDAKMDASEGRFARWAHTTYEIEIALFDDNITNGTFVYEGTTLSNVPHVKVDDFKNPADCGRIYFGIDQAKRRIVVDHVGLHDRY